MNEPILSVAVITYNQEKYIAQTLDSIIEQEHGYTYEIIVGDDCSADETRGILLRYKEKYPDIITLILNEKNMGLIKNYFNVIGRCTGKYIMQCAGDDYWLPGKVALQIQYMEEYPEAGLCHSKNKTIDYRNKNKVYVSSPISNAEATVENLLVGKYRFSAITLCFRKNLIAEYIRDIDPVGKEWLMEDYPMSLWFVYNSQMHLVDETVAVYRELEGSVCRPKDYNAKERFQNSTYDVKLFYARRYKLSHLEAKIEHDRTVALLNCAIRYKNYSKYKGYVRKLAINNTKILIKHIIGKNKFLFLLYCNYVSFRRQRTN